MSEKFLLELSESGVSELPIKVRVESKAMRLECVTSVEEAEGLIASVLGGVLKGLKEGEGVKSE